MLECLKVIKIFFPSVFTINFRVHYFGELRNDRKMTQTKSFLSREFIYTTIFDNVSMIRQARISLHLANFCHHSSFKLAPKFRNLFINFYPGPS